jgi:hypothetical protein
LTVALVAAGAGMGTVVSFACFLSTSSEGCTKIIFTF